MAEQTKKAKDRQGSNEQPHDEGQRAEEQRAQGSGGEGDEGGEGAGRPPEKLSGVDLVNRGKRHLEEMTGKTPETVSGLERQGEGWRVTLEVLEMSRIPPSTDVLGTYQLELTEDGELASYRRSARYYRNQAQGA